jgi:hypothetical protein
MKFLSFYLPTHILPKAEHRSTESRGQSILIGTICKVERKAAGKSRRMSALCFPHNELTATHIFFNSQCIAIFKSKK